MTYRNLGVVWAVDGDRFVLVSSDTNQRWVLPASGRSFEAGTFVEYDDDTIQECSADLVERRPVLVDLIEEGRVYVRNGKTQQEAINPHELALEPGSAVILAGGHVIECPAPSEYVRGAEDQIRLTIDPPESRDALESLRTSHEQISEDSCAFAGYEQQVRDLTRMADHALRRRAEYDAFRTRPPRGVLLAGPPGTGKTTLARKIVKAAKAELFVVKGPEILSSPVGSTEQTLRDIFDSGTKEEPLADPDRGNGEDDGRPAPRLIFFDEIDAVTMQRGRSFQDHNQQLVAQLLTLMDGFESHARRFVIGTTNRIQDVDQAFRRPGRFDEAIELGLPSRSDRRAILKALVGDRLSDESDVLEGLAGDTEGWSGADLSAIVGFAVGLAIDDGRTHLWPMDLLSAHGRALRSRQGEQPRDEAET